MWREQFWSIEEPAPNTKWIVVHFRGWLKSVSHLSRQASFVGMFKCGNRKTNEFRKAGHCFSLRCLGGEWRSIGYLPSTGTENFSRVILNKLWGTLLHTFTKCVYTRWTYNSFFITSYRLSLYLVHFTRKATLQVLLWVLWPLNLTRLMFFQLD